MNRLVGLIVVTLVVVVVGSGVPPERCDRSWRKVGCFHDRILPDRPFPEELVNHRDPTNPAWDKHILDWHKWPESLHALACKCAKLTREKGYKFFGLQFFGECWSGPTSMFYRDGDSDKCIGNDYKPCNNTAETECVGKSFTNYIYQLTEEQKIDEKVPGGWSEWSHWTQCSAKCNGGERTRERVCDNPNPANGGAYCEGESEASEGCNEEPCEPVCKKELEVGIIIDASSSVTLKNWNKTIDFVQRFSEEFVVSPTGVHFGIIHFAWKAYLDFAISDQRYWNPAPFKARVAELEYTYGGTRTDLALQLVGKKFFCASCGLRANVPKLLLVLTDGKSSIVSMPMPEVTKDLKKDKVNIIAIGIGNQVDESELLEIATDENHVFILDGYQYLSDKINQMLKVSCQAKNR